jgi:hypothetical protein
LACSRLLAFCCCIETNIHVLFVWWIVPFFVVKDAIGIFAVACLNAFGNHRQRHLALKSGITIRAATVNVLYEHVLRLSPKGKVGLTSGEITNLFATGKFSL